MWVWIALLLTAAAMVAAGRAARRRNLDVVLREGVFRRREQSPEGTRHIFVSIVDHYEPFWRNPDVARARARVQQWSDRYPTIATRFRDRGGNPPRHAFFYPEEEYPRDPHCMDMLAGIVRAGYGEVEVHLHHDRDTAPSLRERLTRFVRALRDQHGLLHTDPQTASPVYAFIHGNWVLGNSGRNGEHCGVDEELMVLAETGCYGDFTFPSAPHPSQPPVANRIYYAAGDPRRPRAHHRAREARLGTPAGEGPLIVTGPLTLNWAQRRRGFLPALENGDLTGLNPPTPDRADAWIRTGIGVADFPRWIFVKTHTHGAQEKNAARLLADGPGSLAALFADLLARYNDGGRYVLHFSTPWEMARAVRVLEANDADAIRAIEQFQYRF